MPEVLSALNAFLQEHRRWSVGNISALRRQSPPGWPPAP